MTKTIPISIYRGGTSRGLFFHQADLPESIEAQDEFILKIIGSGHQLQVNGLGGGNPLTSKVAVIGPPTVEGADLDYTFLYPSVLEQVVDRKGNCGNISSAVGPFAVNEGLVTASGEKTSVLIHNTNTNMLLRSTFQTHQGRFRPEGYFEIDGVPGSGSRIVLEFLGDPEQPLLPTGNITDRLEIPGFDDPVEVTIVRAGNLSVFWNMADARITGQPQNWLDDTGLWERMEAVRGAAAVRLGMARSLAEAKANSPAVPKVVAVGHPAAYTDLQGREIQAGKHDVRTLMAAMGVMHRSFAVTATVATAAAAGLPGSVVFQSCGSHDPAVRLGHPSGTISAQAEIVRENGAWQAKSVAIHRTARHILDGKAYL